MPTHQRLGLDDREDLQTRRKPSIQLDKEPAITVGEPNPAVHLTPQNDQLMPKCRVLCFKPPLRLEWRGQDGQDEAEQCKHYALTLGDSFSRSNADEVFGTHREAEQLGLPFRGAVFVTLVTEYRASETPDVPIEVARAVYRADLVQFRLDLSNGSSIPQATWELSEATR